MALSLRKAGKFLYGGWSHVALTHYTFEMTDTLLTFQRERRILTCKETDGKTLWAKKLGEIVNILEVLEDEDRYYVSCEIDDLTGQLLSLHRHTGSTAWFIPGRPYLQQLYDNYLYAIFMDPSESFYFLKVDLEDGSPVWHHPVTEDLCHYTFRRGEILLTYGSGREEVLLPSSGKVVQVTGE